MEVVVLSGGFDPVHDGHIAMFEAAAKKYDYVVVGLNSDPWLVRKKGKAFMPFSVRKKVLQSIKWIDEVWDFDDEDGSAISLLNQAALQFANVTFGNGGDRKYGNFPEFDFCQYALIDIDDTLGGTAKLNSSSDFLSNWRIESCQRDWGEWKVLNNYSGTTKVKELVVLPGEELSWQSHEHRSELWFVREGEATVYYSEDGKNVQKTILNQHKSFTIPVNHWHQLCNDSEWILSIIEIQYGSDCIESDIMRDTRPSSRI
jgi:cytidyltransferase-like protein